MTGFPSQKGPSPKPGPFFAPVKSLLGLGPMFMFISIPSTEMKKDKIGLSIFRFSCIATVLSISLSSFAHELDYGRTFEDVQQELEATAVVTDGSEKSSNNVDYGSIQEELTQVIDDAKSIGARLSQYDALLKKGRRQLEEQSLEQALASFSTAQRIAPRMAESYLWIGETLLAQNQLRHAEKFALHFVASVSQEYASEGWQLLGRIYTKMKEPELAMASYKNLLMTQRVHKPEDWALAVEAYWQFGKSAKAMELLQEAIEVFPSSTELTALKAKFLLDQERHHYASLILNRWLSMDSNSAEAWLLQSEIQAANGNLRLSEDSQRQAFVSKTHSSQLTSQ